MSGLKSHNEFDSLETFFNTRLKDASLEPTDNSWMLIEEELNKLTKEKRRRRFLWFFSTGLVLVCGLVSLWYFTPGSVDSKQLAVNSKLPVKVENKKSEGSEEQSEEVKSEVKNETESKVEESTKESAEVNNENTESNLIQKIQLGAFKYKANMAAFNRIPYKVIEVNDKDGYTKYYAESNEKDALEKVQQAGFAGAYLKKDFDESLEKAVVKNEGAIENAEPVYYAANTRTRDQGRGAKETVGNRQLAVSSEQPAVAVNHIKKGEVKEKQEQRGKNQEVKQESGSPVVVASVESKTEVSPKENTVHSTQTNTETETTKQETTVANTEHQNTKPETVATNTEPETSKQEMAVTIETKKDSTAQVKEEKKDSVLQPVKVAAADSNKTDAFKPIWSLSFLGGPNFFNANSQSSSVKTLNENQQMTYNEEVKLQFQPMKFLSISAGVNYNTFTAKQDATYFRFYKYQTEDYQFHSSLGSMAVPMSTMLQGFWFNAPTDTFFSKYSYTTTVQTINIPLQANAHFLNTKWVNLYLGLGANSSYAIGQHTHFSLIKENSTVEYNYNNITANKFNLMLMASLGCDIRITKRWYITLNPSYRYGVTNFSSVSGTTYKPAFFSANGGVKFKF